MSQQFFTVDELVKQGYTVEHARQFISREAVHVRTAKATKKAREQAKAPKAVSVAVASPYVEPVSEHNAQVLQATAEQAKRRFVMTPARKAGLEKAHAARRAQAQARREASARALDTVRDKLNGNPQTA